MEVPNWRPAGMDRSISSRTMGVGLTLSTSTEKRYGSRSSPPDQRSIRANSTVFGNLLLLNLVIVSPHQ
jgi:hypothetical protein